MPWLETWRQYSDQPEVTQAGVPPAADDQVVVHGHAERCGGFDDVPRNRDVRFRRGWVAGGMIMHQDQGRGPEFKRPLDHLARVNRRMVDSAALLPLVFDQYVLSVEKKDVKLLDFSVSNLRCAIIDQFVP